MPLADPGTIASLVAARSQMFKQAEIIVHR